MILHRTTEGNLDRLIAIKEILSRIDTGNKIISLIDHKGELTVNWHKEPNIRDLKEIKYWWEYFSEYYIKHEYNGELIRINLDDL